MNAKPIHKSWYFFLLISLFQCSSILGAASYDFEKACRQIGLSDGALNMRVVDKKNSNRSHVTVLQDTVTGKRYILKQLRKISSHPLQVVQEMLGTFVANRLGLLCQKVIIVPPGEFEHFKATKDQAATLHTFINEKPIRSVRKMRKLQLRQIKQNSAPKNRGPNREIIKSMAKYSDLAAIIATDTFLGIGDRHHANLLWSFTLQRFWLIDMDYTYQSTLVDDAIKQMRSLINHHVKLSPEEQRALLRYKEALEKLRTMFTRERLIQLLDEFIAQAQLEERQLKMCAGVSYKLCTERIEKSMAHVDELIGLIDQLIARHAIKKHK